MAGKNKMIKQDKDYCYAKVIIKAFIAYEKNTLRKCRLIDECNESEIRLYIHRVNHFLRDKYKNSSKQIKFKIYKQKTQPWIILYTTNTNNNNGSNNIKEKDPNKRIIDDICKSCMSDWLSLMDNEGKEIKQLKTMLQNSKYSNSHKNIIKKQTKGGEDMFTNNNHDTGGKEVNNVNFIDRITLKVAAATGQKPTTKLKNLIQNHFLNKQTVVKRIEDDVAKEVAEEMKDICYKKITIGAVITYERGTRRTYNLLNSGCDKDRIQKIINKVNDHFKKQYPNSQKEVAFTMIATKTNTKLQMYTTGNNDDNDDDMGSMMSRSRSGVSTTHASSSSKNKEEEEKKGKEMMKQNQKILQDLTDLGIMRWLFDVDDDDEIKELLKIWLSAQPIQEQEL